MTIGIDLVHDLDVEFSMVKYGICYISTKSGPIATKRKANKSIKPQASNVTNGFDLGHDLDVWIFKVKCDLDHLVTNVRCKDLPDSHRVTSDVGVPSTHLVPAGNPSILHLILHMLRSLEKPAAPTHFCEVLGKKWSHSDGIIFTLSALLQLHLHFRLNIAGFNILGKDNCKTRRETFDFF